jgi:NAD(P)-dependent dehydrogenase (short-subunit alcohol dehydrogenase family)
MHELKEKTAIITGASKGIGEATARHFGSLGARTVLVARSKEAIEAIALEIREEGGESIAVECDVADHDQVETAVRTAIDAYDHIDIVINNAGLIDPIGRMTELSPEDWGKVIDVNVKGVYHMMRETLLRMEKRGSGTIINISSGAATSILEGWSHYCSSKAAALMLTRAGDKEYASSGIRVLGLSPGTVATDMQKEIKASGVNPVSELEWEDHIPPEWVAKALAWLATEDAREFDGGDVSLRDENIRKRAGITE